MEKTQEVKTKKVEIYVKSPCLLGDNHIRNDQKEVELTLLDIKLNLIRGNKIWEIIGDKKVSLNLDNYDKDNSELVTAKPTDGYIPVSSKMLRAEKAELEAKNGKTSPEEQSEGKSPAPKKEEEEQKSQPQPAEEELTKAKKNVDDVLESANTFKNKSNGEYKSLKNRELPNQLDKLINDAKSKKNQPKVTAKELNDIAEQISKKMEAITVAYHSENSSSSDH